MTGGLLVYWEDKIVGALERNAEGTMLFRYAETWLDDRAARPISQSLPLQRAIFSRAQTRPFFAGLLPDEDQREAAARVAGVSVQNDYALLDALGGDVAGALTILPDTRAPRAAVPLHPPASALSEADLAKLLTELPRRPFLMGEEGIRMSLAGAQPKLPVILVDGAPALPVPGQPTTHIIKPAITRFEATVENEAFAMRLAEDCRLPVARVEPRLADNMPYLLVERFDREPMAGGIRRIHQEDFCQALAIAPETKYAIEGGPSFKLCFDLVRTACAKPAVDVLALLDAAIFNAAIGNADAHGKNFSLLYTDQGTRLAPLYDLMVTALYPEVNTRLAMPIGRANQIGDIDRATWDRFATDMGLGRPYVRRRVHQLCGMIHLRAGRVANQLRDEVSAAGMLDPIVDLVRDQVEQIIARLDDVA